MLTRSVVAFTGSDVDVETLIQRMFQFMSANDALPPGMTIDEARPFLKGMITLDSARRQNIHVVNVEVPNLDGKQDVEDEELEDHAFPIQISPSKVDNSVLEKDGKQDIEKTPAKPPGIDNDGLEMSALARDKIQQSAKAFGLIKPVDDITLREEELVNLEKSKKSFGRVMTPEEHAAAFLKGTQDFTPEERLSILMKATNSEEKNADDKHEVAKQRMDALLTRLQIVKTEIEPMYVQLIVIEQQIEVVKSIMRMDVHRNNNYQSKMAQEIHEVQDQLMRAVRATEAMLAIATGHKGAENFDISSPTTGVSRRLSFGSNEFGLPCPRPVDAPVDFRDHMGGSQTQSFSRIVDRASPSFVH